MVLKFKNKSQQITNFSFIKKSTHGVPANRGFYISWYIKRNFSKQNNKKGEIYKYLLDNVRSILKSFFSFKLKLMPTVSLRIYLQILGKLSAY